MSLDDVERELDNELAGVPDEETYYVNTPTDSVVPDEETAHRFSLAYKLTWRDIDTIEKVAEARKAEIDAWVERRSRRLMMRQAWLQQALDHWTRARVGNRTTRKYVDTPDARLALTKPSTRVEVTDEAALLEWAISVGTDEDPIPFHEIKYVPRKSDLGTLPVTEGVPTPSGDLLVSSVIYKHAGDEEGSVVPGVMVVRVARDTFKITPTQETK
jgi:hypothetical protein